MDKLRDLQAPSLTTGKRNRALSVNQKSNQQLDLMEKSLDHLQSLLHEVQMDWSQTTHPHANPLDIALPLLDTTSVGLAHRKGEFIDLKDRIDDALQATVTQHYQAFNDSIGSYRTVVQNIANSKQTVDKVQQSIIGSVKDLEQVTNNQELKALNENVKNYNDMIAICNVIEYLQKTPNDLEIALTDKNYTKAQQILTEVSRKANQFDLWRLPALANLHDYYQTQKQQLFEILIEELHSIIYSKSDFTNMEIKSLKFNRLDSDSTPSANVEQTLLESINIDIGDTARHLHSKYDTFIKSFSESQRSEIDEGFEEKSSVTQINYIKFDDASNPFHQILKLLKIINELGNLQQSLEIVTQRITTELNQLINKVIEDLKLKYPKLIKSLNTTVLNNKSSSHNATASSSSQDLIIVSELFWNFFRKILFFFQAIKSIIIIRESLQPSLKKNISSLELLKLWSLLKDEIKNFILTYISNEDPHDVNLKLTNSALSSSTTIDSSKLFQFVQVDCNKDSSDKLKSVFTNLFPGFVNSNNLSKIDSPYIEDSKFLKQTRILPTNVMNMKYILEPFLLFIQGTNLLIMNDSTIDFFNDFMNSQFLPLLEESLINLYIEEVEEVDSLDIYDTNQITYDSDLIEADEEDEKFLAFFIEFKNFLNELCFMLNTSSQFRPEFIDIIFKIITKFNDKVEDLYKELHNELISFLEPNKEFILSLVNPTHVINKAKIRRDMISKNEYQNTKVIKYFKYLNNSLTFIITLLSSNLVKTIEINKIDLNLSHIEKIRKNWSFLGIPNFNENIQYNQKSHIDNETSTESLKNQNKMILDDELRLQYNNGIVLTLQKIQGKVKGVLKGYDYILEFI